MVDEIDGEEEAYLMINSENTVPMKSDTIWAKIGDDGSLETIRWDIIEAFAADYDGNINNRDQTHVMCKLLVLVRDQARKEGNETKS